ncbi:MAG: response regulator [Treponema sp.]|nr:response regulator [Treponema sp.]
MDNKILLVCTEVNFLVKTLIKSISDIGFEVVVTQPDIVEIQLLEPLPDIFIVYLEGNTTLFNGTLKFLKNKMSEDVIDRVLYLIGNETEINAVSEFIPKTLVTASFTRPVNVPDILTKLKNLQLHTGPNAGRKRILVVDDDATALRAMNNLFSKKYDVSIVTSGINAISFLTQDQQGIDLILLDYEMPGASGLQVFEMLKNDPRTALIPVIFLTSKDDKDTVLKILSAKPEKYLLKNQEPEQLMQKIDDFFKGR